MAHSQSLQREATSHGQRSQFTVPANETARLPLPPGQVALLGDVTLTVTKASEGGSVSPGSSSTTANVKNVIPGPPRWVSGRTRLLVPEIAPALVVTRISVPPTSGRPAGSLARKQKATEEPPSGTLNPDGFPEHDPSACSTPTDSCVGPVNNTVV